MAGPYYIKAAGNNSDGLSWANAFTSVYAMLNTATTPKGTGGNPFASGEILYIDSAIADAASYAANTTITGPTSGAPALFYSVTVDTTTYAKSATNQIDTSNGAYGLTLDGAFAVYGVQMKTGASLTLGSDSDEYGAYNECTFVFAANQNLVFAPGNGGRMSIINCHCDLTADGTTNRNSRVFTSSSYTLIEMIGMTFTHPGAGSARTNVIFEITGGVLLSGCDFSGFNSSPNGTPTGTCEIFSQPPSVRSVMTNCKTISSFVPCAGPATLLMNRIEIYNCGPSDDPTNLYIQDIYGTIASSTSVYRDGGGTVEGVATSWLFTTTANCDENRPFYGPWGYGTLASTGSKTFTVYCANTSSTDYTNAEVWLEVEFLATSNAAQTDWFTDQRSSSGTGSLDILAASATQTTETSSTWTGITETNRQALAVTATVNESEGQYRWRVVVGKASVTTLYIDPKVTVT